MFIMQSLQTLLISTKRISHTKVKISSIITTLTKVDDLHAFHPVSLHHICIFEGQRL